MQDEKPQPESSEDKSNQAGSGNESQPPSSDERTKAESQLPNGSDSLPSDDSLGDQKKTQLEIQKLQTELKYYETSLILAERKVEADLKDWRIRLLVAIITTLVGVLTFLLGQAVQKNSELHKEQLQRGQDADKQFGQFLSMLGLSDETQRSLAARGLGTFITSVPPEAEVWEKEASKRRSDEAIGALASRLNIESSLMPIEQDSLVLETAGSQALAEVAQANRRAAYDFARKTARYIAWSIKQPTNFQPEGCQEDDKNIHNRDNQGAVSSLQQQLGELVVRSPMPLESNGDGEGILYLDQILGTRMLKQEFFRQCRLDIDFIAGLNPQPADRMQQQEQARRDFLVSARQLSATSITLVNLLHGLKGKPPETTLDNIFIVAGKLDDLNLSETCMKNSYVSGVARSFHCKSCDLTGADLRYLYVTKEKDLTEAKQSPCTLPATEHDK